MALNYPFLCSAFLVACSLSTLETTHGARSLSTATTSISTSSEAVAAVKKPNSFKRDAAAPQLKSSHVVVNNVPAISEISAKSAPAVKSPKAADPKFDQSKVPGVPELPDFPTSPFPDFGGSPPFGFLDLPFPDMPLVPAIPLTPQAGDKKIGRSTAGNGATAHP